jgi:hypothetical protein
MRGPRNVLHVLRVANFLNVAVVNDAARGYLRSHLAPGNALRVAALAEAHADENVKMAEVPDPQEKSARPRPPSCESLDVSGPC